jgi:hypothetical protein
MSILQKEKLLVIKKELLHLWHISDFYKSKDDNRLLAKLKKMKFVSSRPKELTMRDFQYQWIEFFKKSNDKSQRELISQKIHDDINTHLKYIQKLNEDITNYYNKFGKRKDELLSFLTLYDFYNQEIKKLLEITQYIQSKFLQFQQEHFNQYMPVPSINKRYSSKGFLDYLKDYHTEILENEDKNIKHPVTLWGHSDSFRAHQSLGKSNEKYVEIPYWNYEIPFMLPIITHEMGHIILENGKFTELNKIKDIFINSSDIKTVFKDNESFLDEILSDIFAYLHHGSAYIISATHELLGLGFSYQFYSKNKNEPISINPIDIEEQKFIEALVRLKVLIFFSIEDNPIIEELKNILHWIILEIAPNNYETNIVRALKETKNNANTSLAKIYHYFYNLDKEYIDFHYAITNYTQAIEKVLKDNENQVFKKLETILLRIDPSQKKYISQKNKKLNKLYLYKESFNNLSDDRITLLTKDNHLESIQIEFKNKLRKIILTKEDVLNNNAENKDIGSAYELVMFKTRMDRFEQNKQEKNYIKILSDEIKKMHHTVLINASTEHNEFNNNISIDPKFTFDYYSMLALVKKRESITIAELNRYLEYKSHTKTAKYYTNKYSLILLEKHHSNPREDSDHFSAFISLSLTRNDSKNTKKAIQSINNTMKKEKFQLIKYEIYKSLGPKEMVIHLHHCSIGTLYAAKRELFQDEDTKIFHRSYTTVYTDPKDINKLQIKDPYYCGSSLRAKTNTHDEDFGNSNIHSLLMTTGVKDYTIQWKENTPMISIMKYYDELAKNGKFTDVQTFLMKRINETDA